MINTTSVFGHVIWDWNGTLLDDKWLCIESINTVLLKRNLPPIDENTYHRIFRFPVRDYYGDAGFDFDKEPFEVPAMEFIDLYDKRKKECRLQPAAREILDLFEDHGIVQHLLSASETGILQEMTDHFGIRRYFRNIKGLDNHYAAGKKELGFELIDTIDAAAGSIVMIGDTCHDQEVAEFLHVRAILCTHGHFPEARLTGCGTTLIRSLSELRSMISAV